MKEIEIKFCVKDIADYKSKLKKFGAKLVWNGTEENYFFDTPSGKLKKEKKNLRLRKWEGHSNSLTLKTTPKRASKKLKTRNEYQVEISDIKTAQKIMSELGYVEYLRYKKYREHWTIDGVCVELDKLGGFHFVEIEGSSKQIAYITNKLGLDKSNFTLKGYLTILREIKKTGRFKQ